MGFSAGPYQQTASLLNDIWERRVSLKTLVYNKKGELTCHKSTYAQVCKVLANRKLLDAILRAVPVEGAKNQGLLYVLLFELLLGPNKKIKGGGALKRKMMEHHEHFLTALADEAANHPDMSVEFPRYVRVNTWLTTTAKVVAKLRELKIECYRDAHVPDLLVLPTASTRVLQQDSELISSSQIVLQDKSSCFSALCLARGFDSPIDGDYLDACAAPGNKTSHLAALVLADTDKPTGKESKKTKPSITIHALDRSSSRLESLEKRMAEFVPTGGRSHVQVVSKCKDYLAVKPQDYASVRAILLDPSCSGSGIFTALDRQMDDTNEEDTAARIQSVSNFQVTALKHSMSFPNVECIVYSTCSIHSKENEEVVEQAVNENRDDWEIVPPKCLATWKRRGVATEGLSEEETNSMIRVDRGDDTNGFFVCCLQRKTENKKKTKKTKPAVTTNESGLAVYAGQFAKAKVERTIPKVASSKAKQATSNSPKAAGGGKPNKAADKSPASPKTKAPKKPRELRVDIADDKHAKKRAKKLDWKAKQKEKKAARVLKKQKTTAAPAAPVADEEQK